MILRELIAELTALADQGYGDKQVWAYKNGKVQLLVEAVELDKEEEIALTDGIELIPWGVEPSFPIT